MADWRTEIKTAGQKEVYIRNVLEITAPKKSQEYRSAYQRLRFYAEGKTKAPTAPKYKAVEAQAQVMADVKERKRTHVVQQSGKREMEERAAFVEEPTYIQMEVEIGISKERRRVSKGVSLDDATALEYARNGDYFSAWVAQYFGASMVGVVQEVEVYAIDVK